MNEQLCLVKAEGFIIKNKMVKLIQYYIMLTYFILVYIMTYEALISSLIYINNVDFSDINYLQYKCYITDSKLK